MLQQGLNLDSYLLTVNPTLHETQIELRFHLKRLLVLLWRIEPLLGKDLETNHETTTVFMQRRDKHASTTIKLLSETVFSMWCVPRSYFEDNWSDPVSSQLKISL
jgi:hypothetical protein